MTTVVINHEYYDCSVASNSKVKSSHITSAFSILTEKKWMFFFWPLKARSLMDGLPLVRVHVVVKQTSKPVTPTRIV